jgi:hypothetical protein
VRRREGEQRERKKVKAIQDGKTRKGERLVDGKEKNGLRQTGKKNTYRKENSREVHVPHLLFIGCRMGRRGEEERPLQIWKKDQLERKEEQRRGEKRKEKGRDTRKSEERRSMTNR